MWPKAGKLVVKLWRTVLNLCNATCTAMLAHRRLLLFLLDMQLEREQDAVVRSQQVGDRVVAHSFEPTQCSNATYHQSLLTICCSFLLDL